MSKIVLSADTGCEMSEAERAGVSWAEREADAVVDWSRVSASWQGTAIDALPLVDSEDEGERRDLAEDCNAAAAARWTELVAAAEES